MAYVHIPQGFNPLALTDLEMRALRTRRLGSADVWMGAFATSRSRDRTRSFSWGDATSIDVDVSVVDCGGGGKSATRLAVSSPRVSPISGTEERCASRTTGQGNLANDRSFAGPSFRRWCLPTVDPSRTFSELGSSRVASA
jgi:hypothetical protein